MIIIKSIEKEPTQLIIESAVYVVWQSEYGRDLIIKKSNVPLFVRKLEAAGKEIEGLLFRIKKRDLTLIPLGVRLERSERSDDYLFLVVFTQLKRKVATINDSKEMMENKSIDEKNIELLEKDNSIKFLSLWLYDLIYQTQYVKEELKEMREIFKGG